MALLILTLMKSVVRSKFSYSSSSRTVLLDDADPTRFNSLHCVSTSFTRRTYAYPTLWWDIMSWARLFSARFVFPDWRQRRRRSRKRSRNKIVFPEHKREVAETKIRTHDLIHDLENISALDRSTTVGRLEEKMFVKMDCNCSYMCLWRFFLNRCQSGFGSYLDSVKNSQRTFFVLMSWTLDNWKADTHKVCYFIL